MTAQSYKVLSYLAAFLVASVLLLHLSALPVLPLLGVAILAALLWGAVGGLARQGLAPLRGPLKGLISCVLLAATLAFLTTGAGEAPDWGAALQAKLRYGEIWYLLPPAIFAGACLAALDTDKAPNGRVISSLPDLAFGLGAMAFFYLGLRQVPQLQEAIPALWGETWVHYLILAVFFFVVSYISRCAIAVWRRQAVADHATLMPAETSLRRFMQVVVRALPMLGFLGTVLGISQALSGLPELVAGDGNLDPRGSAALGSGLSSIAIAFETTILGLITSLIATLALSYVEKLESDLVADHARVQTP